MTTADDACEHLTATIWEVLRAYTSAPLVHHADMIHTAAERYASALAAEQVTQAAGRARLAKATAEAFPGRRP